MSTLAGLEHLVGLCYDLLMENFSELKDLHDLLQSIILGKES